MYRVLGGSLACVASLVAANPANASSLVALGEVNPSDASSIVMVGEANAPVVEARRADEKTPIQQEAHDRQLLVLSGSILAVGPDAIPVAAEEVASVEVEAERPKPKWIAQALPAIIRGGMHGHAGPTQAADASSADNAGTSTPDTTPR